MSKPVTVTIPHRLGKDEAKRRIERGLGTITAQVAPYVTSLEQEWRGDSLGFRLVAVGQAASGTMDVLEDAVRIELALPGLLGFAARRIADRMRAQGTKLLGKS